MSHVGGKGREPIRKVDSRLVPFLKAVDGESVPQIMDSGASASSPMSDSTSFEKFPKGIVNTAEGIRLSSMLRKEGRLRGLPA